MYPELFRIPVIDLPVKSYGFMLMAGFLTAIWFAMRRAERVKADPDTILNLGFVALICGVAGARVFYVAHYWESQFTYLPNRLWAAFNITAGGLEYYGGLFCAIAGTVLYLRFRGKFRSPDDDPGNLARRRPSMRLYLDIVAPAVMWGLAFGRLGCFLNGCCWGGLCIDADNRPALPWAVRFPYGSPAYVRQWEELQRTAPAELIVVPDLPGRSYLIPRDLLALSPEQRLGPQRRVEELQAELESAKADNTDSETVKKLENKVAKQQALVAKLNDKLHPLDRALQYPSRIDPSRDITYSELQDLAAGLSSLPVHPAQLYGTINAFMLSLVLSQLFYRRRRHGLVFGVMLILYPITRVILELIRCDNPHDSFGLTISQAVSVGACLVGIVFVVCLYKFLPIRSPRAVPFVPPAAEATRKHPPSPVRNGEKRTRR